jgi:hypothetical protein
MKLRVIISIHVQLLSRLEDAFLFPSRSLEDSFTKKYFVMKKLILFICVIFIQFAACIKVKNCCEPLPSLETTCISTKIKTLKIANKDFTSVKRFIKNGNAFWLFDTGAAFDAPQYLLNTACDTVCTWVFRANTFPCQKDYNLNDSTAVVIWRK